MNRSYRLIWSAVRDAWVPAAENTRGQGKRASRPRAAFTQVTAALAAATLALGSAYAQAGASPAGSSSGPSVGPSGGAITAGSGSISQSGTLTTAPQWGATPQIVDASTSIDVLETASEPTTTDAGVDQDTASSSAGGGIVINVAMQIGATGTLKIVSGGLRLPITHLEGNP
jgi:hypothetical protein